MYRCSQELQNNDDAIAFVINYEDTNQDVIDNVKFKSSIQTAYDKPTSSRGQQIYVLSSHLDDMKTRADASEFTYNPILLTYEYPPKKVEVTESFLNNGETFTGEVQDSVYGNGTYKIEAAKQTNGGIGARPLSRLFDKEVGTSDPNRLLHEDTSIELTFTFPQKVIIKELYTHNNNSCQKCTITIEDDVYENDIDITGDAYAKVSIDNNTYSNKVIVTLHDRRGSIKFIQNSEFYFKVVL